VSVSVDRRAAVLKARDIWVGRLVDLSRRNKLLFFRDLKTGTLDLSSADARLLLSSAEYSDISSPESAR
jgi:hypothetical protein